MYDNKEVARITKTEIEKQQYKEREGTDYLLAVSPNIPKNVKNGILGKREGITLVRRDIVVEVAEHLRNAIIEISKSFESKKDQETKQARIYDFITSREFCRRLESLDKDNSGQGRERSSNIVEEEKSNNSAVKRHIHSYFK